MPRKAKRMQAPAAPQEQGYGQRGEQIAAQHQMGIPDNRDAPPLAAQAVAGPDLGGTAQPPPDPAMIQQMMAEMAPPPVGGLARPSERPDEDLMAGVGGQVAPTRNVAAEALDLMAQATGDPRFTRLAQRARMI